MKVAAGWWWLVGRDSGGSTIAVAGWEPEVAGVAAVVVGVGDWRGGGCVAVGGVIQSWPRW